MPGEKLSGNWTDVEEEFMHQRTTILANTLEKELVNIRILGYLLVFAPRIPRVCTLRRPSWPAGAKVPMFSSAEEGFPSNMEAQPTTSPESLDFSTILAPDIPTPLPGILRSGNTSLAGHQIKPSASCTTKRTG